MSFSNAYDPRSLPSWGSLHQLQVMWRVLWVLLFGALALALLPLGNWVVGGFLILHALRGTRQSVEALTILGLILMWNRDFIQGGISILRWLVLLAAFARTTWDLFWGTATWSRAASAVLAFVSVAVFFSMLNSRLPSVSLLKAISFGVGAVTTVVALNSTRNLLPYWRSWFLTVGLFVLFASVPLYFTSLGFMVRGTAFKGVLSHSQTMGVFASIFGSYITGKIYLNGHDSTSLKIGAGLAWFMVFASASRTAALSAAIGFSLAYVVRQIRPEEKSVRSKSGIRVVPLVATIVLLGFVTWKGPAMQERVTNFLIKDSNQTTSAIESLQASRMGLIERSMNNFWESPLAGIGFGVPSEERLDDIERGFMGLPISATIEKGFLPASVLEETGIIGFSAWLFLIGVLFYTVLNRGDSSQLWVLTTCIMVNAGEAIFFAIGGNGLFMWLFIGFALIPSCYSFRAEFRPRRERFQHSS